MLCQIPKYVKTYLIIILICFSINFSQSEDAGNYMCVATNDAGVLERSVMLTLQSKCLFVCQPRQHTIWQLMTLTKRKEYSSYLLLLMCKIIWIRLSSRCSHHHSGASGYSSGCWHHSCAQLSGRG